MVLATQQSIAWYTIPKDTLATVLSTINAFWYTKSLNVLMPVDAGPDGPTGTVGSCGSASGVW